MRFGERKARKGFPISFAFLFHSIQTLQMVSDGIEKHWHEVASFSLKFCMLVYLLTLLEQSL